MRPSVFPTASLAALTLLAALGCKGPEVRPVLRQSIPVSSVPLGARILVNGQPAGQTPATLDLERTRDHIVTLLLDHYRQEDVIVRHLYQRERTLLKAVQSGLDTGMFFKDARMGLNRSAASMSDQKASGEAFLLEPTAISVTLQSLGAEGRPAPTQVRSEAVPGAAPSEGKALARDLAVTGAALAVAAAQPEAGKTWDASSSKTTVSPDGRSVTKTTTRTRTSVKVGVSPEGVARIIDKLFK